MSLRYIVGIAIYVSKYATPRLRGGQSVVMLIENRKADILLKFVILLNTAGQRKITLLKDGYTMTTQEAIKELTDLINRNRKNL